MRYVYCRACGNVSTNIWMEKELCTNCGAHAERVKVRSAWQSYASSAILVAVAGFLVFGPPMADLARWAFVITAIVGAFALSSWGLSTTRAKVLASVGVAKVPTASKVPKEGHV